MNRTFYFLKNKMSGGAPDAVLNTIKTVSNAIPGDAPGAEAEDKPPSAVLYWIYEIIRLIIILSGIMLTIVMLPVFPFLLVSYAGFHGKFGIIKLIRENYNIYRL
jgi:hypothetical protein